jgi:metal-responsive CopG/Arc/MetJ family transcriptional regulator
MKNNKEYIAVSLTIDADLKEKMDKMLLNKSRFINDLIKKQIKEEKNK